MTVKLGINPIGWTNDCMQWLGDFITLEQCLTQVKEAGFSGVERPGPTVLIYRRSDLPAVDP